MTFSEAITRKIAADKELKLKPMGQGRRNPGRQDGVQWSGSQFVPPERVDGRREEDDDDEESADWIPRVGESSEWLPPRDAEIDLLEIARPGRKNRKKGGIEEHTSLAEPWSWVTALEESLRLPAEGHERWEIWEDMYDAEGPKRLYSEAVQGEC
ncbi:hypothetical protein DL96DRAFT_1578105 [Flagelloscypha sp. PMI_526]|nr:hypothetical protein DL96DRAFT_1578105 [Flagelloscypha sp. PMI_526]